MKIILRRFAQLFSVITLLVATQACAESQLEHESYLLQKAVNLSGEACAIYPSINDVDVCLERVVLKILTDRDVSPERASEIIREQAAASAAKHPPKMGDVLRSKEEIHQRMLVYKLVDIIRTACATPPVIADIDECMDKAYHSILSSRDPHSGYLNAVETEEYQRQFSGELQGIGVATMYTSDKAVGVIRVMEGSPAERAGLQDGDRIVGILDGTKRLISSPFPSLDEALKRIRGKPNTKITLEILRGESDQLLTITIVRGAIMVPMVKSDILVVPNASGTKYAYIRLVQFGRDLRKKMVDEIIAVQKKHPDIKGIVFDLRGNPGGLLGEAYEAIDALADSPESFVSIRDNDGIHAYPTAPGYATPKSLPGDITQGLPIGVLIDRGSASASEIFAGALKKLDRSVTIGTGTWRKGTVQSHIPMADGSLIKMTIAEYLIGSPTNWVAVQCVGVDPDIGYEMEGAFKPKKEKHECDLEGAVVSGGRSSDPSRSLIPLYDRDPARYYIGLEMRDAVKVFDNKESAKINRVKKLLKIVDDPNPGE